jgi:hypothetical protein
LLGPVVHLRIVECDPCCHELALQSVGLQDPARNVCGFMSVCLSVFEVLPKAR